MAQTKTTCPISREHFRGTAEPLAITVEGKPLAAEPKEFGTGSLGFYAGEKVVVEIGGTRCVCQVGVTITLVASKELPKD